ncbi:ROK family protein, partial [Candidatus Woesearchaeota archaeon]|nr:ROK family protein [Candidatus Woesearchaeota archaeon]
MAPVLAADIGGTNIRLAIYDDKYNVLYRENHETAAVADFHDMINDFLEHAKPDVKGKVVSGCFAVAGPVKVVAERNRVEMTNAHFIVDESLIERNTHLENARVLNDFTAIGYCVNVLKSKDYKLLRKGKKAAHEPKVVVGAGTGLGIAILVPTNEHFEPIKSEGGHAD